MSERGPGAAREGPPAVPPSWFDGLTGGIPPAAAAAAALDRFADALRLAPRWMLETGSGGGVTLRVRSHCRGKRLEFLAERAGETVEIALEPDPSGWLSIAATYRGRAVFSAWLDRPYEAYEFWPAAGAVPERRNVDAPGGIGKRYDWINLSAAAWPQLARFANAFGVVAASEADEPSRDRSVQP